MFDLTSATGCSASFAGMLVRKLNPELNPVVVIISVTAIFFFSVLPRPARAETPVDNMRKYFAEHAGIDDEAKLDTGETIAKLLPSEDKREVSVFGLTPVKMPLDFALTTFQDTMARQNKKSIMAIGNFSAEPSIDDLKDLTLESDDIVDIKECRPGNCRLNLSTEMAERFQREIDWNAPDYGDRVNQLFRQMILEYVNNYLARGNTALIDYDALREPVDVKKEQSSLLKQLAWVNDHAPEFAKYLSNYPSGEPANVRKSISWAKLKFGLKPVIVITQTITYSDETPGMSQILSVSKQLYASRYFDSSLGLTALIGFPSSGDGNSYLLYTNQSRSSALDGAFSNLKHKVVDNEAIEKVRSLLEDTKVFGEAKFSAPPEAAEISCSDQILEILSAYRYGVWFLILVGGFAVLFAISRPFRR